MNHRKNMTLKVLETLEWQDDRRGNSSCPICDASIHDGHKDGCELQRVLNALRGSSK